MTQSNIVSGFKVTGVYPFDRNALCDDPATESRLPYLPLLTPSRRCSTRESISIEEKSVVLDESTDFDDSKSQSPDASPTGMLLLPRRSSLSEILQLPSIPKVTRNEQKKSSRVLTSTENLKILQQKKEEKEDLARERAERKAQREAKREELQRKKAERQEAREAAKKGKCKGAEDDILGNMHCTSTRGYKL